MNYIYSITDPEIKITAKNEKLLRRLTKEQLIMIIRFFVLLNF